MPFDFDMKFVGWNRVITSFEEPKKNELVFTKDVLTQIGNELVKRIQKKAPKDTGAYAKTWKISNIKSRSIIISSTADPKLFVILEFSGAKPHRIEGNPVLRFEVNGQEVFARYVDHPGQKAQPHVRPSLKELEAIILNIVYKSMDKHFPSFMRGEGKKAVK